MRDVAAAEDALSGAFASALADCPLNGCPSNPEAWLLTVARRKIIDGAQRLAVAVRLRPDSWDEAGIHGFLIPE